MSSVLITETLQDNFGRPGSKRYGMPAIRIHGSSMMFKYTDASGGEIFERPAAVYLMKLSTIFRAKRCMDRHPYSDPYIVLLLRHAGDMITAAYFEWTTNDTCSYVVQLWSSSRMCTFTSTSVSIDQIHVVFKQVGVSYFNVIFRLHDMSDYRL